MGARPIESPQEIERAGLVLHVALIEDVRNRAAQHYLGFPRIDDFEPRVEAGVESVLPEESGAEGMNGRDLCGLKGVSMRGVALLHQAHEHVRCSLFGEGDR